MNKLLRILTAIFAITTALLGFASYLDKMPPEYAAVIGLVTAVLLGIKEIVVVVGDIADDGQRNGSYKPDASLKQWTGMLALGALILPLSSCAPLTVSQREAITRTIVPLSQLGLSLAQSRGVIQEGDKVLIGQGVALILDDAASTRDKVVKLSALGVQAAVDRGALLDGDALLIGEATAIIERALPSAEKTITLVGPEPQANP